MREFLHRPVAERLAGSGLRRLEQRLAGLVARARDEPVHGQQQGTVVGPQCEHRGIDPAAREKLLEFGRDR